MVFFIRNRVRNTHKCIYWLRQCNYRGPGYSVYPLPLRRQYRFFRSGRRSWTTFSPVDEQKQSLRPHTLYTRRLSYAIINRSAVAAVVNATVRARVILRRFTTVFVYFLHCFVRVDYFSRSPLIDSTGWKHNDSNIINRSRRICGYTSASRNDVCAQKREQQLPIAAKTNPLFRTTSSPGTFEKNTPIRYGFRTGHPDGLNIL